MSQDLRVRFGDWLLERGVVGEDQLEVALQEQRRRPRPLGEILQSLGMVGEDDLATFLAQSMGLERLDLQAMEIDPALAASTDRGLVEQTRCFPIAVHDGELIVGIVDPGDPENVSRVQEHYGRRLRLQVATEAEVQQFLRDHLGRQEGVLTGLLSDLGDSAQAVRESAPVEQIVDAIFHDGISRGATDIHVEPEEGLTRIRYRVDGLLGHAENLPAAYNDAVISRIKILAGLDIAERRRPQDGRMRVDAGSRPVDVRVSTMPCAGGENVVLRLLDSTATVMDLEKLGIGAREVAALEMVCQRPHGLFLVTGPTGSGKTTTLYAMLSRIQAIQRKVATVEDPVECRLPLIRQTQVDPSIGFTFERGLRSMLRQDPDVILVGEIRDEETADLAVKASLTGHLVFSTLHTNSALGAIPRLLDLGIEPYLVEDTLVGVLAQRLVRKVCKHCAVPADLNDYERAWLGDDCGEPRTGAGCGRCRNTGYSGRVAICEMYLPDDRISEAFRNGADVARLRALAVEGGFRDMVEDGRAKVRAGVTTVAEVDRVSRQHRISREERGTL